MSESEPQVLVVTHSHWDREWYKTAEAFRLHLVALVDDLLEGRDTGPFLLDGQTIVLRDYLEWRPERREYLVLALRDGTIEAGPWFVLGDNLIASGETIVRNLLLGRQELLGLGVADVAPTVLYCPDSFGHPAAMPLVADGFGLPMAVVWRGLGGRGWPEHDAMRWQHESGAEVLVYHLPPAGYGEAANIPTDPAAAASRWASLLNVLGARSTRGSAGGVLLALNGADHHAPQLDLDAAVDAAATAIAPAAVARASLAEFVARFTYEKASEELPVFRGELRASPSYVWALQGTFSARAHQKRRNAKIEWGLLYDVEPWVALASWQGTDFSHNLTALWRETLTNHPHDTLCGCSIDAVAHQFDARCERVEHAMRELRTLVLGTLSGAGAEQRRAAADSPYLEIRNPSARTFSGVVECDIDLPIARVPVGPGSAGHLPPATRTTPVKTKRQAFGIGNPFAPQQVVAREYLHTRVESPRHYPINQLVDRHRTLVWISDVPAYGVRALRIDRGGTSRRRVPQRVVVEDEILSNGLLSVWFDGERGLCVRDDQNREHADVLGFESIGEQGDLYTHSQIPGSHRVGVVTRHRITRRGPLRAALALRWRVPVTARTLGSATGVPISRKHAAALLDVIVELDAGSRVLRLKISGENAIADYRLRAVVRSGCPVSTHMADAAFGFVERPCEAAEGQASDVEIVPPTHPLHRSVSVFSVDRGLSVLSDGMGEYECGRSGDIAVTLVRATGELSRGDLLERPGHAGWPSAVPDAQCNGPFACVLGVYLHGPHTSEVMDGIAERADAFVAPARGETRYGTTLPNEVHGPALRGEGLHIAAVKPSESGAGVVVRVQNISPGRQRGSLGLTGLRAAWLARLDERQLAVIPVENERVEFFAEPHAVLTFVLAR